MKKILLTLVLLILFIPGVNAEAINIVYNDTSFINDIYYFNDYESISSKYSDILTNLYNDALNLYNDKYLTDYPYYLIQYNIYSTKSNSINDIYSFWISLNMYKNIPTFSQLFVPPQPEISSDFSQFTIIYNFDTQTYTTIENSSNGIPIFNKINSDIYFYPLANFESNFNIINKTEYDIQINNIDGISYSTYNIGDIIYSYKVSNNLDSIYTEVNLDKYEYAILSLKDYSKNDAFDTNLQVKGMIGITPVYEFGTIEKTEITDRCNISYSDYTDYRLYILKNDLINNAVYYVKACQDGSSFKFDSSIFDITYVTADNVDDPVITVGGKEYHTIPFNKLSNSANKNESENFIPGQSGDASFSSVINSITDYISSFWNGLITFMGFVTKLFNTLPVELRAICITTFITGCTLGLIKIIKS